MSIYYPGDESLSKTIVSEKVPLVKRINYELGILLRRLRRRSSRRWCRSAAVALRQTQGRTKLGALAPRRCVRSCRSRSRFTIVG